MFESASKSFFIKKINKILVKENSITTSKFIDYTGLGLFRYRFSKENSFSNQIIKGDGLSFDEKESLLIAWGEFVERSSFFKHWELHKELKNSNGFASHISRKKARSSALAELVERDVFLSSWLLREPSVELPIYDFLNDELLKEAFLKLKKEKVHFKFGIYGKCLGYFVGVVIMTDEERKFALSTAAKRDLNTLADKLFIDVLAHLSDWRSPNPPEFIEKLPSQTRPYNHNQYYLNTGFKLLLPILFTKGKSKIKRIPDFEYNLENLTDFSPEGRKSGYYTYLAKSNACQNLWFGNLREQFANLDRLSIVKNKKVVYSDLNHEIHPLP